MALLLFFMIVFAAWQGFYYLGIEVLGVCKAYTVPSPYGVCLRFFELCQDGSLLKAILYSLMRGMEGFLIALVLGIILGICINHFSFLEKTLKQVILGIQTLPSVCWVPFSILWFGLSGKAILFVVVMGSMFSIAISLDNSIKSIQPIYKKAALTMGVNRRQMYRYVIFPACLPEFIAGIKQGWSFAWRALMAGEVMTTSIGLGQTLILGRDLADINQVTVVMLIIVLIGIAIDKLFFANIQSRILKKRGLCER